VHADTVLVMDDITPWKPCGVGPAAAWADALKRGLITQRGLMKEGVPVTAIEPPGNRLWAVGSYNIARPAGNDANAGTADEPDIRASS
jgi:hypothetical protein